MGNESVGWQKKYFAGLILFRNFAPSIEGMTGHIKRDV